MNEKEMAYGRSTDEWCYVSCYYDDEGNPYLSLDIIEGRIATDEHGEEQILIKQKGEEFPIIFHGFPGKLELVGLKAIYRISEDD
jgi:hypothetical protein